MALGILSRLKLQCTPLRSAVLRIRYDLRRSVQLSWRRRLWAWRHGFTSLSYLLYELDRNDPADYFPDFVDIDYRLVEPARMRIRDKLYFSRWLASMEIPHARVLATLERGRLLPETATPVPVDLAEWLQANLTERRRLVVKPIHGGGGQGILFVTSNDSGLTVNGERRTVKELVTTLRRLNSNLVTGYVEPATYATSMFPGSANTLRLLTLWDPSADEPFLAAAAHRIGSSRSEPVDNFHGGLGGLSAAVDLNEGRLGLGATLGRGGSVQRFAAHPETGARIEGVVVPHWSRTRQAILELAAALPQYPYVGWDLIVTEKGPVVLEANSPPGTWVWQVNTPLLRDARSRGFYRAQGMLRGNRKGV